MANDSPPSAARPTRRQFPRRLQALVALALAGVAFATAIVEGQVVLENSLFRYQISSTGKNLEFLDRRSGVDYLRRNADSWCALVRREGKEFLPTAASMASGHLALKFDDAGVEATLKVQPEASWIRLEVESVKGSNIESLVFVNVPLALRGRPEEPFGACAFALNLITHVEQLPALQSELHASAHRKFGLVGAKVALVGMPPKGILAALKDVLLAAEEMPLCKVAGPWAQEIPFNHGSYLFNFGTLTEANAGDWIEAARSLGFSQIDNHGGSAFFRFGDFELNREKWPEGWESYRRIVARLHAAGIGSIFHTYAFFIDKHSRYVTPVPDRRLDAFRQFTLAADASAGADLLPVNESTAGISTVTGFFEQNSVVLQLEDELVSFSGVSAGPPWHFTGVMRGALGTKASPHPRGTKIRHLKECFGLFVPDPESSLFEEIAANHAEVVNRCGFDGIYLDAIDGSSILRGADECWYWADKFVMEIQRRLTRPVGMEMSAMWHHFWQYRTRWQAWDYPQRGYGRFVDLHAEALNDGLLLPRHLGWWNFQSFNPPQIEPTYPDIIECLGARLVGWDAGISLTGGADREQLRKVPLFRRAVDTLRVCEEIRREGTLSPAAKAKLRDKDAEFSLFSDASGRHRFRHSHSESHTLAINEPWTLAWQATNAFLDQPAKIRIEALMSAASNAMPHSMVIGDLAGDNASDWTASAAVGVTPHLSRTAGDGFHTAFIQATNSGRVERRAAWVRYRKALKAPLNLKQHQALGLWIEGDGQGELIAIRLQSPQHLSFGAVADRYIPIDFRGKRWVTLVETESARWSDFIWDDGKSLYNLYRETIDFGVIDSVEIWCQNLPPGRQVNCGVGPIIGLALQESSFRNPALTVNGVTWSCPAELTSGSWLECSFAGGSILYDAKGEVLGKVTREGTFPVMRAGRNDVAFSCQSVPGAVPRAKVTLFFDGSPL